MIERSELRDRAVRAMLPVAEEEGWTGATVRAGLAATGENPALAESHFPGGPVSAVVAWADLADRDGGGYSHVTTRCNLQVREIQPERGSHFLEGLADVGIIPRGAGADNIVSAIIVEFRALDTLGEIGVLFVAGAGVASLVLATRYDRKGERTVESGQSSPRHEEDVLG